MGKLLLSIDPGTTESAYTVVDEKTYQIIAHDKVDNESVIRLVKQGYYDDITIEGITSYGQPIGQETLDTIFLSGRLFQIALDGENRADIIPRKDVKKYYDVPRKVNADSYIRRTLINRFATFDKKNGKGTKAKKDWFYGIKADRWQAYALAVFWIDTHKEK